MLKKKTKTGAAFQKALDSSNYGDFAKAVEAVYADGGGSVDVMKAASINSTAGRQETVDISDVIKDPDFRGTVKNDWKDGLFILQVYDKNTQLHSEHYFALGKIDDPRAKRTTKKKSDDEGKAARKEKKAAKKESESTIAALVGLVEKTVVADKGGVFDMQRWMEMEVARTERAEAAAERRHDREQAAAQRSHELQMEELKQRYSNQGSSSIDEALAIIQVSQALQPQIEREDGLTQILGVVSPIIGGLLGRGKPGQQFTPQQIEAAVRAQLAGAASGTPAPAPAPGMSLGGDNGDTAAEAPAPPAPGSIQYFQQRYFDPFRRDAAAGASDDELAYQIIAMTTYAADRMPGNPPAILIDFLSAETMIEYSAALMKFFAAIPELANLQQRQAGIREALVARLMPGPTEAAAEVAAEDIVEMSPEQQAAEQSATAEEAKDSFEEDLEVEIEEVEIVEDGDNSTVRETVTEEGTAVQDHSDESVASAGVEDETVPG